MFGRSHTNAKRSLWRLLTAATLACSALHAPARADFTTIINVPPNIGNNQSIGSDTQLNMTGGSIGNSFDVGNSNGTSSNIEVNISAGSVGAGLDVYHGSVVNFSGGTIGSGIEVYNGGQFNVSGGTFADEVYGYSGSTIRFYSGTVGADLWASAGANVQFLGGMITAHLVLSNGSTAVVSGGTIGGNLAANSNSQVDVSGGTIKEVHTNGFGVANISAGTIGTFTAETDGRMNVSGGSIGDGGLAMSGSDVTFSGGSIGDHLVFQAGSKANFVGSDFRANGVLIAGLSTPGNTVTLSISSGTQFTGSLSDGTPFAFFLDDIDPGAPFIQSGDSFGGTVMLKAATPAAGLAVINVPFDPAPRGVRQGQTITVGIGGVVADKFAAGWGSSVVVTGGHIGANFEAAGANVTVNSGSIEDRFDAFTGSTVTVNGGSIGNDGDAFAGSVINLTGGALGSSFQAQSGSIVNISGGTTGELFSAESGSVVNITGGKIGPSFTGNGTVNVSGGSFGDVFVVDRGGVVLSGGEFRINGSLIAGVGTSPTPVTVQPGDVLNGTLADGTPFAFSTLDGDITPGFSSTVKLRAVALPAVGPATIDVSTGVGPYGARQGQTITLHNGGRLDDDFNAGWGSTIHIEGGQVGDNFEAVGATVTVSGGTLGDGFDAFVGSNVTIAGGEFQLNGVPVAGLESVDSTLPLNVPDGAVLSGVLADGTPFAFSALDATSRNYSSIGDYFASGALTLKATALPVPGPMEINVPQDPAPAGVRGGQTLRVATGGAISDHFIAGQGSTIVISGGTVGRNFEAVGTHVTVTGGTVGEAFDAFVGSTIDILGGSVGDKFDAFAGSTTNIDGGSIGNFGAAFPGSVVNLRSGSIGNYFQLRGSGVLNISGGSVGDSLSGGTVNVTGGKIGISFRPSFVNISGGSIGAGFIVDGLPGLPGAVANIFGGTLNTMSVRGTANFMGGTFGVFGSLIRAEQGGVVNIISGTANPTFFDVNSGAQLNVSGGHILNTYLPVCSSSSGCSVNISGGTIGGMSVSDSAVGIYGTHFEVAGIDITSTLTENLPFTLTQHNVTLRGTLADGSQFDFSPNRFSFGSSTVLTITLVSGIPGDFNSDGTVNAADYTVWRNALGTTVAIRGTNGDANYDGKVTLADYYVWKAHYGQSTGGGSSVPEPASGFLGLLAACGVLVRLREPLIGANLR